MERNLAWFSAVGVSIVLAFTDSSAYAQSANVVITHQGQNNPMSEGFFGGPTGTFDYTAPAFQGGIGPVTVAGTPAWRVFDVVQAPNYLSNATTYEYLPTTGGAATPTNGQDWLMSAHVDPFPVDVVNPGCPACTRYNAMMTVRSWVTGTSVPVGNYYAVAFEEQLDGTALISWELLSNNTFARTAVAPAGFIWVEMLHDSGTNRVGLYVNGVLYDDNVAPLYASMVDNRVTFGDHQFASAGQGGADWATVRFERGPDPIVLQGAGCGSSSFCVPTANSASSGAQMNRTGTTSIGANNLRLFISGLPTFKPGAVYLGAAQAAIPFGNGTLCIGSPQRLQLVTSTSVGTVDFGVNLPNPALGLTAGTTSSFQYVFRDPAAGGARFNTSSALSVTFCP